MPACTTPELWPVWWTATACSFSTTTTRVPGWRRTISRAVARPTMPAPTMPMVSSAMAVASLGYGRHAASRAEVDGDGLHARGEAQDLVALLLVGRSGVAEPTEGQVDVPPGGGGVDRDLPALGLVHEAVRAGEVAGEDGRGEAEVGVVDGVDGRGEVVDPADGEDRAEDFLAPDRRVGGDVGEDGRPDEAAVGPLALGVRRAAGEDGGALLDGLVDVGEDAVALPGARQRAQGGRRVAARAAPQRLHLPYQQPGELLVHRL